MPITNDRKALAWVAAQLTSGTRRQVALVGVLDLVARLAGLTTALSVGESALTTLTLAAVSWGVVVLKRLVAFGVRVNVERDLHVAITRAVLDTTVVEEPPVEPHAAVADGVYASTELFATVVPALVADVLASVVALAALASVLTPRVSLLLLGAGVIVGVLTLALRARITRTHEESLAAQEKLRDAFATALHGRLEIVANGTRTATSQGIVSAADHFAGVARRSGVGIALLGRAPLLLAGLATVAVLLATETIDVAHWQTHLRMLAVLATAAPVMLGLVVGGQSIVRARTKLGPLRLVVAGAVPSRPGGSAVTPGAVAFEGVGFGYPGAPLVLDAFTAQWDSGALVLRGSNGSGKTTVLRLLAGLVTPTAGAVRVGPHDLAAADLEAWRARIAFLPQRPYVGEPYATVGQAFDLVAPATDDAARMAALARAGLATPLDHAVGHLSVGQRQRLALARVLARGAEVLLLDEPDANLDAEGIERVVGILEEELAAGRRVAVAAHGPIAERLRGTVWDLAVRKEP